MTVTNICLDAQGFQVIVEHIPSLETFLLPELFKKKKMKTTKTNKNQTRRKCDLEQFERVEVFLQVSARTFTSRTGKTSSKASSDLPHNELIVCLNYEPKGQVGRPFYPDG